MTDIRDRLREADPLLNEPALSGDEVARMRRTILAAAPAPHDTSRLHWKKMLPLAAAVALIAGAGVDTARRTARQAPAIATAPPAVAAGSRTQLQFSTPGGTRIIWTIDPAFQLTEKR
jgi:hypothetical protein